MNDRTDLAMNVVLVLALIGLAFVVGGWIAAHFPITVLT